MKWNHYRCPECGGITVTQEFDNGVTPFLLRCRAKDLRVDGHWIEGCRGLAESSMYRNSQAWDQTPHVIFFRPDASFALAIINTYPKADRAAWLEHYQQGGALERRL